MGNGGGVWGRSHSDVISKSASSPLAVGYRVKGGKIFMFLLWEQKEPSRPLNLIRLSWFENCPQFVAMELLLDKFGVGVASDRRCLDELLAQFEA